MKSLVTNKNNTIAIKSSDLSGKIKELIFKEIFEKPLKDLKEEANSLELNENIGKFRTNNNSSNLLTDINDNNNISNLINGNKETNSFKSLAQHIDKVNLLKELNKVHKDNIQICEIKNREMLLKKKKCLEELKNNIKEETINSDVSLHSYKTDCEETTNKKAKIKIYPLEKAQIFSILESYLNKISFNEENLTDILMKGIIDGIHCHKIHKPIKFKYMRKRVCYKIYTVFEKIVNLSFYFIF